MPSGTHLDAPVDRHRCLALVVSALLLLPGGQAQDTQLQDLVRRLGALSWRDRSDATDRLLEMGHQAREALTPHLDSQDLELQVRARYIHARTRFTIPFEVRQRFPELQERLASEEDEVLADALESVARYDQPAARALALEILAEPDIVQRVGPERVRVMAQALGPAAAPVLVSHLRTDGDRLGPIVLTAITEVLEPTQQSTLDELLDHLLEGGALGHDLALRLRPRLWPPSLQAAAFARALTAHASDLLAGARVEQHPNRAVLLELAGLVAPEAAAAVAREIAPTLTDGEDLRVSLLRGAVVRVLLQGGHLDEALAVPAPLPLDLAQILTHEQQLAALRQVIADPPPSMTAAPGTILLEPDETVLARVRNRRGSYIILLGQAPLGSLLLALGERMGTIPTLTEHRQLALRLHPQPGDVPLLGASWVSAAREEQLGTLATQAPDELRAGPEVLELMLELADSEQVPVFLTEDEARGAVAARNGQLLRLLPRHGTLQFLLASEVDRVQAVDAALAGGGQAATALLAHLVADRAATSDLQVRAYLGLAARRTIPATLLDGARGVALEAIVTAYERTSQQTFPVGEAASAFLTQHGDPDTAARLCESLASFGGTPFGTSGGLARTPVLTHLSDQALARLGAILADLHPEAPTYERCCLFVAEAAERAWRHGPVRVLVHGEPRGLGEIQVHLPPRDRSLPDLARDLSSSTGLQIVLDPDPGLLLDDVSHDLRGGSRGETLLEVLTRATPARGSLSESLGYVASASCIVLTSADRACLLRTLPYAARALRLEHPGADRLLRHLQRVMEDNADGLQLLFRRALQEDPTHRQAARTCIQAADLVTVVEDLQATPSRLTDSIHRLLTGRPVSDHAFLQQLKR